MKLNNLFSKKQFGFLGGRSTVLQLLMVLDKWTEILDQGGVIDVIYCDFMKAFDKVPHNRLLEKIACYGICGKVHRWLQGFLLNRHQRVMVQGSFSKWHNVLSGIPQGSVLGPLMFVMYINDLPTKAVNSELFLFADDTKIFKGIFNQEDCTLLQQDLDRIQKWTNNSLLQFHPDKCKHMRIGHRDIPSCHFSLGNPSTTLAVTNQEKDIGVLIDSKLSFEHHIAAKIIKANSILGLINRTFEYKDGRTLILLYKSLVRPHLEYANQIWAPHLVKHITQLENVQRRATKIIPGLSEFTYQQRLAKLQLPTLAFRRLRVLEYWYNLICLFTSSCVCGPSLYDAATYNMTCYE